MDDVFVAALLSKIDLATARRCFAKEKPSLNAFSTLINKLIEQRFSENLEILSVLLNDFGDQDEKVIKLKARLHGFFLIQSLTQNSTTAVEQLKHLENLLAEDKIAWQEPISALANWVQIQENKDKISELILLLKAPQREHLYQLLLETANENPFWLDTLIAVTYHSELSKAERQKLTGYLLLSPNHFSIEKLKKLTLILSTEQLEKIIFQLRANAATYASSHQNKEHLNFLNQRNNYLFKYDALITALTVRATTSPLDYQKIIKNKPELANLLMVKRLETQQSEKKQKKLIFELLKNYGQYDWQELAFKTKVMDAMLDVFAKLTFEELSEYFKLFYQQHAKRKLSEIVRLLDALTEKTSDTSRILQCIQENDDVDNTLTINFISNSQIQNHELTEKCLERLTVEQLTKLCGHIMALRDVFQQEQQPLFKIFCKVLSDKIKSSSEILTQFNFVANTISLLPDTAQVDLIQAFFEELPAKTNFRYQWLLSLLSADINKKKLFGFSQDLFRQISSSEQLILLHLFSQEDLLALYLHFLRNNAKDEEFSCFIEKLKVADRQNFMLYFLLNTPLIKPNFLNQLLPMIDWKNLIFLVENLLEKLKTDQNYNPTVEQVLQYFCQCLAAANKTDPIHQWVESPQSAAIAQHLLSNPACLYSLCQRPSFFQGMTSGLLQGFLGGDAATDLKLRAIRILEHSSLDLNKSEEIALRLLSHFQQTPNQIQTIFTSLDNVQGSLNEKGRKNYNFLKQSCWNLLNPKDHDINDENLVSNFLKHKLTLPHRFDPILAKITISFCTQDKAHLGAQYLEQIDNENLSQITDDVLATILVNSMQETTKSNWHKIGNYLKAKEAKEKSKFIEDLLVKIKTCNNNPLLIEEGLIFIRNMPGFETFLPLLNDEALQWLVKETKAEILLNDFPKWFDILLAENRLENLDCGALLSLLPQNQSFFDALYQREKLTASLLTKLFVELANYEQATPQIISISQQINKESQSVIRKFTIEAQRMMKARKPSPNAISIINLILLRLLELNMDTNADCDLLLDHFKLLARVANNPALDATQAELIQRQLQQLLLNMIASFRERDSRWTQKLMGSEEFSEFAQIWLKQIDNRALHRHPLTHLLIDYSPISLADSLVNHPNFQLFIAQLLTNPPAKINEIKFAVLFANLTTKNQIELALKLLQQPTLDDVQWSSLFTLSQVLSVEMLYKIYTESETRFVFVDLLVRHPQGIEKLSTSQTNKLLAAINSGKQILRILDSYSPPAIKFNFINKIFAYLEHNQLSLSAWFTQMNFDSQTLVAFLNYSTPDHKENLNQLLATNSAYGRAIRNYLQEPSLEMNLEPNGLLHQFMSQVWLQPWKGWSCHSKFFDNLDTKTAKQAIRSQFQLLKNIKELSEFYKPLAACEEVATPMLIAARWIHQLPLIADGLLEIASEYQEGKISPEAIKNTEIFKQILFPLQQSNSPEIKMILAQPLENLFELLKQYYQSIKKPCPRLILDYQHRLSIIEEFSCPGLYTLFSPHSYFAKLNNGSRSPIKTNEANLLSNALELHQKWLVEKKFFVEKQTEILFNLIARKPDLVADERMRLWLMDNCLFSSLTYQISEQNLANLISIFSPKEFNSFITKTNTTLKHFGKVSDDLKPIMKTASLSEIIDFLLTLPVTKLKQQFKVCELAQLTHLMNLLFFCIYVQKIGLSQSQVYALLPSDKFTNNFEIEWFQQEIEQLPHRKFEVTERQQKLKTLSLSYQKNDDQNESRLQFLKTSLLNEIENEELIKCLNSYYPCLISDYNEKLARSFLDAIQQLFTDPKKTNLILHHFSSNLVAAIINFATKDLQYAQLLQEITLSDFKQNCKKAIIEKLIILSDNSNNSEQDLSPSHQLSKEQLGRLPTQNCESFFTYQRLLFLIEPLDELKNLQNHPDYSEEIALFCAEASFYSALETIHQQLTCNIFLDGSEQINAIKNINFLLNYFSQENKQLAYFHAMEKFINNYNIQYPVLYFHWIILSTFLTNNNTLLVDHFVKWFSEIDKIESTSSTYLAKILALILDRKLIKSLCLNLPSQPPISLTKLTWLFEQTMSREPLDDQQINDIISICPWSWLQEKIKSSSTNRLILFFATINNTSQIRAIISNEENRLEFLSLLQHCQISVNDLLFINQEITDPTLNSLIALHLLSRPDYISKIPYPSFLNELSNTEHDGLVMKPLQPLIHQLDLATLPLVSLKSLQPEAAASLFCTVKHFHALDESRINLILDRKDLSIVPLVSYWLRHYANFPNAATPLLAFIKLDPKTVLDSLAKLTNKQIHSIITLLIKNVMHWESFGKYRSYFLALCDESHLILLAQLYIHGGQRSEAAVAIIYELTEHLISNQADFSMQTLKLLIQLSELAEFSLLAEKLEASRATYLRTYALFDDCTIFYDDEKINIKRMQQTVSLKKLDNQDKTSEVTGFSKLFKAAWQKFSRKKEDSSLDLNQFPENPLINELRNLTENCKAFDYFLIHYQGSENQLKPCLEKYLGYFEFGDLSAERLKQLHSTIWLLHRPEAPTVVRETLFTSLLAHPQLIDEDIAAALLIYDVERTIKKIGQNKNYSALNNFCSQALPRLGHRPEIQAVALRAQQEAIFESSLSQMSGFMLKFRQWFKRCIFYGWTGFFHPKTPRYVLPCYQSAPAPNSTQRIITELTQSNPPIEDLDVVLSQFNEHSALDDCNRLFLALTYYELLSHDEHETKVRARINALFDDLAERAETDKKLEQWLENHDQVFINNRGQLIAGYLREANDVKLRPLIEDPRKMPLAFRTLPEELLSYDKPIMIKEPEVDEKGKETKPTLQKIGEKIYSLTSRLGFKNEAEEGSSQGVVKMK